MSTMFVANVDNVFPLIVLVAQVIGIVDFNFDGNPKSDAQVCCMVEYNFPREPFVECVEKFVKDPDQDIESVTVMCIHQCYYEAIGMFSEGQVMVEKYRQHRDTLDPDVQEAFAWALTYCAEFVTKTIKATASLQGIRCNPIPYLFNRCLSEVDIVNCPPKRWMNSSLCTKVIQKLERKYGENVQMRRK